MRVVYTGREDFRGRADITIADVQEGVTRIRDCSFANCTNLIEVVSRSSTLESIGPYAFLNCRSLVTFTPPQAAREFTLKVGKLNTEMRSVRSPEKEARSKTEGGGIAGGKVAPAPG